MVNLFCFINGRETPKGEVLLQIKEVFPLTDKSNIEGVSE
jgi:hypothetical protein